MYHIGLGWSLSPMTGVLITREKFGHKHTQEECHVMTEAEMGEIFRSQEFQVLTTTTRSWVRRMKHTLPETCGYREQCGSCQREGRHGVKGA